jgi:Secretion system C-terminal sorting domain
MRKSKSLCFVFLLLTFLKAGSQTNTYFPFPDSNAVWHEHFHSNNSGTDSHYQYGYLGGDTVLNNKTWHKVYQDANCLVNPVMSYSNSILMGALREDSAKRIYYYNMNTSFVNAQKDSIYKLYDFSKQIGDTIKFGSFPYYYYNYLVLDSIDSAYTHNKYRKRYHLSPGNETWIEGIGSLRGLFTVINPALTCYCIQELFCYRDNDTSYYIKPPYIDCYNLSAGIDNKTNIEKAITIAPNPFSSNAIIKTNTELQNASLVIYNSIGEAVKQMNNLNGKAIPLDCNDLAPGLYFIKLVQGYEILAFKKIILLEK